MAKKNDTTEQIVDSEAKSYEFKSEQPIQEEAMVSKEAFDLAQTQYLRLQADFDNYKKRNNATASKAFNDGIADVIKAILPSIDYLDMAILAQKDESQRKGIELVKKSFEEVLKNYDVIQMDVLGKDFDPNFAEAVMNRPDENNQGKVVEVLKQGYVRKDVVLRHAMVIVGE